MARGKYECKPETAVNRFFKNTEAIDFAFSEELEDEPVSIEYYWGKDEKEGETVDGWQVRFRFSSKLIPIEGAQYAMHGDIGISKDAAGVAMSHVRKWREVTWTTQDERGTDVEHREMRPIVKVDFMTAFKANPSAQPIPLEVQIRWYRKLCYELIARGFNIRRYTYDGFQSTDSMQILTTRGIESKRVSTDMSNDVWDTMRDIMYDGRLEAYYHEEALTEIKALNKLTNGKVDHPPGGSKDIADSVGGAIFGAVFLGGAEGEDAKRVYAGDDQIETFAPVDMPVDLTEAMLSSMRSRF